MISSNENELSLQEIQHSSLEIVKIVRDICNQNDFKYYLAFGTLIGAIRHKGFIPWDDDLDIMMPRKDYDKLLTYFRENEKALYPIKIFNKENTDDYPYMISRVSNVSYRLVAQNERSYGLGTFIDIYPLDGLGSDYDQACKIKEKASRLSSLCYLSTRLRCEKEITKGKLKMIIKYPAFAVSKIIGTKYFMNKLNKFKDIYDYADSKYISCVTWGSSIEKGIYSKEQFGNGIDVVFEGETFRAPLKYDTVLHQLYGDYMKMPPENERIQQHFYTVYRL